MIELNSTNYTIWKPLMKLLYGYLFRLRRFLGCLIMCKVGGRKIFWTCFVSSEYFGLWLPTTQQVGLGTFVCEFKWTNVKG